MKLLSSCKDVITQCLTSGTFALAHLYNDEKPMDMHIHDSYEIYYSISGGKQFLIDNRFYSIHPGDIFFINQYESHHLTQIDSQIHERILLSIHPDYLKSISSPVTDLDHCFSCRPAAFGHRISLSDSQQKHFLFYIHKLSSAEEYGSDLLEKAAFLELMVYLNSIFIKHENHPVLSDELKNPESCSRQVDDILTYINRNIRNPMTIKELSDNFYLSPSYLCKIFKSATGTTINKYITAKRISYAKSLLSEGYTVNESCELSGFNDYSNFLKAFSKAVGISPKKYAQFTA